MAEVRDKINKKVKKQLHPYRYRLVFALRFKSGGWRRGELNPCDNPCLRALAVSLVPNIKRDRSESPVSFTLLKKQFLDLLGETAYVEISRIGRRWLRRTSTLAISKRGKNCIDLSGERIDHSVHRSSCTLHNAVSDILGCLRSALCHVGCRVDGASPDVTNGDGDGQNDRKEHSHSTKVFVAASSRARQPDCSLRLDRRF